jgi:hypothetical protein
MKTFEEIVAQSDLEPEIVKIMQKASPELKQVFVTTYNQVMMEIWEDLYNLYHTDRVAFDEIKRSLGV